MAAIKTQAELHIVMFPWLAFGHISPFVQVANKLSFHGFKISMFSVPGNIPRIKSSLLLSPDTQIIPITIPSLDGLPPSLNSTAELTPLTAELLRKAVDLTQPQVKSLSFKLKPDFVMFDCLVNWVPSIASELGIKTICFSVFTFISGAYVMVPMRSQTACADELLKPPSGFPSPSLTSMKRYEAQQLLYVFKNFYGPSLYQRVIEGICGGDALLIKTCNEMEGAYVNSIGTQFGKKVLAGPLVPEPPTCVLEEKRAKWLAQFPLKSVIFCSFGSETFLKDEQIQELALGLEYIGFAFILVLNFPAEFDAQAELGRTLPPGFLERLKDRGIVHTGWVPQQLILGHENVGCFLCHSGFSSLIEAMVNDCQLVLLPLKGDQLLNSKLMALDMKAGVEVNRRDEDGYFGKKDIEEAVRAVMVDVEKEPGISTNHKKWREFLSNREIQDKFIADLVEQMKTIALSMWFRYYYNNQSSFLSFFFGKKKPQYFLAPFYVAFVFMVYLLAG